MEKKNMVAHDFFYKEYAGESENIQIQRINDALLSGDIPDYALDGYQNQELISKLKQLEHSNDAICDVILVNVLHYTQNKELKNIIERSFVGFVDIKPETPHANPQFFDGSYLIVISRWIEQLMIIVSEYFALKSLVQSKGLSKHFEREALDLLLHRVINNDLQPLELFIMKYEFLDEFVGISSEIFEVSLAFIIGHEYGHHYYKHTRNRMIDDESIFNFFMNSSKDNNNINKSHVRELQADLFATYFAHIYISDLRNRQCNLVLPEAQLLGFLTAILTTAIDIKDPTINGQSHPSSVTRLKLIMYYLGNQFNLKDTQNIKEMLRWFCEESGFDKTQKWVNAWWKSI